MKLASGVCQRPINSLSARSSPPLRRSIVWMSASAMLTNLGERERGLSEGGALRQRALFPDDEDHRVDEQFENRAGDDAADHRRGDAFHHVGAGLRRRAPHDREQSEEDRAN